MRFYRAFKHEKSLSLGAGDLGGSLLMTNFINAAVEVLCYILLPLFIDHPKIGRVWGTVWTMGLGSLGKQNLKNW